MTYADGNNIRESQPIDNWFTFLWGLYTDYLEYLEENDVETDVYSVQEVFDCLEELYDSIGLYDEDDIEEYFEGEIDFDEDNNYFVLFDDGTADSYYSIREMFFGIVDKKAFVDYVIAEYSGAAISFAEKYNNKFGVPEAK